VCSGYKIARLHIASEELELRYVGNGGGERVKEKEIYIVTEIARSKELTTNYELQWGDPGLDS